MSDDAKRRAYEAEREFAMGLFRAAVSGDVEFLKAQKAKLDQNNLSILDYKDGEKRTILHVASHAGSHEVVSWLAKCEPSERVNAEDANGMTPLYLACHAGKWKCVVELLPKANLDELYVSREVGATLTHAAVSSRVVECARVLLDTFTEPQLAQQFSTRTKSGATVFHWAIAYSETSDIRTKMVTLLLSKSAIGIDVKDDDGLSPMSVASSLGDAQVVRALLEAGSKVSPEDVACCVETNRVSDIVAQVFVPTLGIERVKELVETKLVGAHDETPLESAAHLEMRESYDYLYDVVCRRSPADKDAFYSSVVDAKKLAEQRAKQSRSDALERASELKVEGNALFKKENYEDALDYYERGAKELRDDSVFHEHFKGHLVLLGELCGNASLACTRMSKPDEAMRYALEAKEANPTPKALNRLGLAHASREEHAEAAQAYWDAFTATDDASQKAKFKRLFTTQVAKGKKQLDAST